MKYKVVKTFRIFNSYRVIEVEDDADLSNEEMYNLAIASKAERSFFPEGQFLTYNQFLNAGGSSEITTGTDADIRNYQYNSY